MRLDGWRAREGGVCAHLVVVEQVFEGLPQLSRDGEVPPDGVGVGGVDVEGPVAAHNQPWSVAAVHCRQIRCQKPVSINDSKARHLDSYRVKLCMFH